MLSMIKQRFALTALWAFGLLVLVAGAMLYLRSSLPPRPHFQVMVNTMVITNDHSGARNATFQVANSGRYAVLLLPIYGLENRSGRWRTNLLPAHALPLGAKMMGVVPFPPEAKRLEPGQSCTVTLGLPFDDLGWRASFWCLKTRRPIYDDIHQLFARIVRTKSQDNEVRVSTSWTDQ